MYQRPELQRFGTFRELTLLGFNSNTDGAVFLGVVSVSSPGCSTNWGGNTYEIGCDGPTAS